MSVSHRKFGIRVLWISITTVIIFSLHLLIIIRFHFGDNI